MAGAVCPACGVAVVPGYVRCPKCHRPLPRFARNTASPVGGTTLSTPKRGSPLLAIALAIIVGGGFIAFFALRGGKTSHAATAPTPDQTAPAPDQTAPSTSTVQPVTSAQAPVTATHTPKPGEIATALQNTLEHMELWSTVAVTGPRVELQSGSCRDPQLEKQLAGTAAAFKAAGLTRVRCVEQSGAVVFDREL
jgi:hypothetical protein